MNLFKDDNWTPMLLETQKEPFASKDYIYEIKFDGLRAILYVSPTIFKIHNRHAKDITAQYPELKKIQKLVQVPTVFDGEIVSFLDGKPSFSELQKRMHNRNNQKIIMQSQENPVVFICFDILYQDKDLTQLPLKERKKILNKIKDTKEFIKSIYIKEKGILFYQKIKELDLEGMVAKELNSGYYINERSDCWVKIKNFKYGNYYIGAYSEKKNTPFISAHIGEYQNNIFTYVGKVSIPKKEEIYVLLKKEKGIKKGDIIYVSPKYLCKIEYLEKSKNHKLRQPVYRGLVRKKQKY